MRGTTLVRVAEPDYRSRPATGITALQRLIGYTNLTSDGSDAGVVGTTFTAARRHTPT